MFGASLLEDLPVKNEPKNKSKNINMLKKKLTSGFQIEKLDD